MDRSDLCGCGKQGEYFDSLGRVSCNKHKRCAAPPPPAEQASGEHVEVLRDLLNKTPHSGLFNPRRDALTAAIAALSQRPAVDEATVQQVIANLNNATAVMRDRPHGGGPDRAWLTSQVNLLRAALAPQQPTGEEE